MNPLRDDPVIKAGFPDKTRAFYSEKGGNEIHYLAADGKAYFWLPNQRNILAGEWIIYRHQQVCYHVTGLTEHPGTRWHCGPIRSSVLSEIAEGDVLGLKARGDTPAPWVMQSQPRVTVAEVETRLKSMPVLPPKAPNGAKPPERGPSAPVPADPLGPMVMNEY
jgi:hypothetical protein